MGPGLSMSALELGELETASMSVSSVEAARYNREHGRDRSRRVVRVPAG